jgi:uncharacterized protein (DUF885 family)
MTVRRSPIPAAIAPVEKYWDGVLSLHPLLATAIGDERFDHLLPDPSEDGRTRAYSIHNELVSTLAEMSISELGTEDRLACELALYMARRDLRLLELRLYRFDPLTHWGDPWTLGPGTLLAQCGAIQRADTRERLERYETRLRAIPAFLRACAEVMEEGLATGYVAPRSTVIRTERQVDRLLQTPLDESPALEPLAGDERPHREKIMQLLVDHVIPAYHGYLESLRSYRERARDSFGLYALSGGEEMYAAYMHWWTGIEMPPAEINELGRDQLAGLNAQREHVARRLGFQSPAEAAGAYLASGQGPASSEDVIAVSREQVDRSWEACKSFFGRLPTGNCDVRPIQATREADVLAYYQMAPRDGGRRGIYFVNVAQVQDRPLHRLAAWSYHETNPGHHLQLALEQEATHRLPIRRFTGEFASGAFVEGWALYAEELAEEMDLYIDDYERLGLLEQQAFRAARLVVDTGIHAFQWNREAVIDELEKAGIPTMEAVIETDRYIAWPGQALSYKLGQLAIERWRAEAAQRLGTNFSLTAFHDRLLALGSLPLPVLEREITTPSS